MILLSSIKESNPVKGPFFHFILLLHPVDFPHPCRITTFDLMSEEVAKEMETKL